MDSVWRTVPHPLDQGLCSDRGEWEVRIPCLCNPGYELDDSQDQCSSKYKRFHL